MKTTRRKALLGALAAPSLALLPRASLAQGAAREVRVGFTQDALTLDPANHRNRETETIIRNMHDGLLTRDAQMRIQPEIAEAITAVDPKTYDVRIRQGIRFHSGDPLTAEDIAFNIQRLVKPNAMGGQTSPRKSLLGPVEDASVRDARTVRLHMAEPWALLRAMLPFQEMVNPRQVQRVGQDGMQTRPDGCGPYKLVDWRRGEAIIMERFAEYYGGSPEIPVAGPAQVDRVIFRVLPENSSRVAALLAGEVDIINDLPPSAMRQVEASRNAQVMKVNGTRTFFVSLNLAKKPFDDVRVRRALNHALDKNVIISRVLANTATPLRGVMSPDAFGFNPDLPEYAHNLDRAKALLAEAGVAQGTEMVIDTTGATREIAEAIAALLSRTGLRVRAQVWEGAVLSPMWQNAERRKDRDMYLTSWGNGALDPSDIMVPTLKTGGRGNSAGFSNAEVDRLLDAAETEVDQEKRREGYLRAQQIVSEQAPWIFLWLPQDIYGVSRRIAGWQPQADSRINLHRVRIAG
ncbi:peptide ABC transporter substrate-binding protein [Falsiroseomonas bella]|uniref:Peptide ABC transporter substrate-binding protein n=1 Tax=Falsiroseomonas bella TaxID=2184016 RepID=A0A317F876_9PROT|nr:ABC transporter substrate-binding protein [Falsiroseomonas bella]PWS34682.1 peptide ABC transporter substrate-binding protein [Falsiroseomonas bella]